jgi:dolichyl-phosphate-mannose-protein mannosyltransferase
LQSFISWKHGQLISRADSFDEVHFGKFAAYYLRREYYFDVHPPFAKLLFALAGWFVGFEGDFDFSNIGDSYSANNVPYWGMRALPAILGSLTVPLVYAIMKESGYSTIICAFSAIIILFGEVLVAGGCLIRGTNRSQITPTLLSRD